MIGKAARLARGSGPGNLATGTSSRHPPLMRHLSTLALTLLLSACAGQQPVSPPPSAPLPVAVAPSSPFAERGELIGRTSAELVGYFGSPALQIHEGVSVKLQFRAPACVLDAYLYPPATGGAVRVTHVDTRAPGGADVDQAACIAALSRSS